MIVIYGSAWRGNSGKDGSLNHIKNAVKKLLKNDFIIVTLNHRSSISHPFPAQIHDVKAAIRFLKGNAKALSIDPNFIAYSRLFIWRTSCCIYGSFKWQV
jgi:acetyl esterase/lipase